MSNVPRTYRWEEGISMYITWEMKNSPVLLYYTMITSSDRVLPAVRWGWRMRWWWEARSPCGRTGRSYRPCRLGKSAGTGTETLLWSASIDSWSTDAPIWEFCLHIQYIQSSKIKKTDKESRQKNPKTPATYLASLVSGCSQGQNNWVSYLQHWLQDGSNNNEEDDGQEERSVNDLKFNKSSLDSEDQQRDALCHPPAETKHGHAKRSTLQPKTDKITGVYTLAPTQTCAWCCHSWRLGNLEDRTCRG